MIQKSVFFKKQRSAKNLLLSLIIFLGILIALYYGVVHISQVSEEEQLIVAEKAVVRAAVQCYALEGAYPKNLSYLKENYSLLVDEDKFIVDYVWIGSNLIPDITVLRKNNLFMEEVAYE